MTVLDIVAGQKWSLKIPSAFRYLNAHYVNDFFATGSLLLTTLGRCKAHEEASRRDGTEGKCNFHFDSSNHTLSGVHRFGSKSYMFCLSLLESQSLAEKFGTDSYFRIDDVIQFASVIGRWIPGCTGGSVGICTYHDEKSVRRSVPAPLLPSASSLLSAAEHELEVAAKQFEDSFAQSIEARLDRSQLFAKPAAFSQEAELRIVWDVPYEVEGPLIVHCTEAIKLCTPAHEPPVVFKEPPVRGDSFLVLSGRKGGGSPPASNS